MSTSTPSGSPVSKTQAARQVAGSLAAGTGSLLVKAGRLTGALPDPDVNYALHIEQSQRQVRTFDRLDQRLEGIVRQDNGDDRLNPLADDLEEHGNDEINELEGLVQELKEVAEEHGLNLTHEWYHTAHATNGNKAGKEKYRDAKNALTLAIQTIASQHHWNTRASGEDPNTDFISRTLTNQIRTLNKDLFKPDGNTNASPEQFVTFCNSFKPMLNRMRNAVEHGPEMPANAPYVLDPTSPTARAYTDFQHDLEQGVAALRVNQFWTDEKFKIGEKTVVEVANDLLLKSKAAIASPPNQPGLVIGNIAEIDTDITRLVEKMELQLGKFGNKAPEGVELNTTLVGNTQNRLRRALYTLITAVGLYGANYLRSGSDAAPAPQAGASSAESGTDTGTEEPETNDTGKTEKTIRGGTGKRPAVRTDDPAPARLPVRNEPRTNAQPASVAPSAGEVIEKPTDSFELGEGVSAKKVGDALIFSIPQGFTYDTDPSKSQVAVRIGIPGAQKPASVQLTKNGPEWQYQIPQEFKDKELGIVLQTYSNGKWTTSKATYLKKD